MKIAELESHHEAFASAEQEIRELVASRRIGTALHKCITTFPNIVPAIQFRKKRDIQPTTPTLQCVMTICEYAPPLFEHDAIVELYDFVRSTKVLAKHENDFLGIAESALQREEAARMLWNHIERHPGVLQRDIWQETGLDRDVAVAILTTWEELGIITRRKVNGSYELGFVSRMEMRVKGTCMNCGKSGMAKKKALFKPVNCQKCGHQGYYYIRYPNPVSREDRSE